MRHHGDDGTHFETPSGPRMFSDVLVCIHVNRELEREA